jgi:hypothetical protein
MSTVDVTEQATRLQAIGPVRLNLGAGPVALPNWINVDAGYGDDCAIPLNSEALDVCTGRGTTRIAAQVYPLHGLPDESVDLIRASHVLEHFPHAQTIDVLREWVRVLKPGGVLKVAVPNFEWIARTYIAGLEGDDQPDYPLAGYVMGGETDERDFHHAIFDEEGLREALESLGLVDVQPWTSEVQDCASLPVSLNLQGRKAGVEKASGGGYLIPADITNPAPSTPLSFPAGSVRAVMTMPRLAFTDNLFCAHKALMPLGIPLEYTGGVFWCQGMTRAILPHLSDGTRYVITIDYDSVYERGDVLELLRVMETQPEIDALCPIQMRREEDSPLFCVGKWQTGPKEVSIPVETLQQDTMPLTTGHFGLTVLRVESLRRFPHPWFLAEPDPQGTWGDGRTDADIAYWRRWKEAGLTLHLANRVAIGHLQMVVSWPGKTLALTNQFISDYNRSGRPGDVWR